MYPEVVNDVDNRDNRDNNYYRGNNYNMDTGYSMGIGIDMNMDRSGRRHQAEKKQYTCSSVAAAGFALEKVPAVLNSAVADLQPAAAELNQVGC